MLNDFISRLQAALGSSYRVDRELPIGGLGRVFLAVEAARLAELAGDRDGAIGAYRQYLTIRRNLDPGPAALDAQVRAELARLEERPWPVLSVSYIDCNMYGMKRTTIFLDEALERRLKQLARREGKSFAQCVREAVAQYVAQPAGARRLPSITGMFAGGPPHDVSERVDEFLWKDPHA